MLWSFAFLAIVLTVIRGWGELRTGLRRAVLVPLAIGAVFLSINWGTYVAAVQAGLVDEASLGYFINPLVSVGLGVAFLGERLRRAQWAAVALAVAAVVVLTVAMGHPPYISLVLAFSFGVYGLIKKQVPMGAAQSLTLETLVLLPVAIGILAVGESAGTAALGHTGPGMLALLAFLGPITAIPLMAFGAAARRIPLATLGLLQYLTPVVQFILGVVVFHDAMTTGRWAGFVLVWVALLVFTIDTLIARREPELAVVEPD